jgi:hypothetical protein
MAYKTNIREVKYPESIEELAALGEDANSMRSLGAAFYKHLAGIQSGTNLPNALRVVFGVTKQTLHLIGPSGKPKLIYIVQGAEKAAEKAGNPEDVKYLSGLLQDLGYEGKQSDHTKTTREILTSVGKHYGVIEEIGKDFEATQKRIRKIEARAFKKLKKQERFA